MWKLMNLSKIKDEDKKALEYIRYLFKDFAFRDEEEFRLLKIEQIGSDNIKYCQNHKNPSICLMPIYAILWMK